ncbi:MAG: asparagine synthase (glutamine-hydrolyzing) [Betaproteobacteria bacterium]|nr:asparagine synthase (glutamine-hydrolyzing) [Betaproteobacteria bacterium]
MPAEVFEGMLDTLSHRGPDGRGVRSFDDGRVRLGHRRLAIIDLSAAAAQPMASADASLWLTFNGEIYNFRELREQLTRRGRHFRTQSDSEVLLGAYEEWGERCVERLRGIFAFGIWNARARSLFLARDHFGVKPLYYARYGARFCFASQPKAILADPAFRRAIDPQGLRDFFAYGFVPHDRCAFEGIRKLPAGHSATLKEDSLELRRYWRLKYEPDLVDPAEAAARLRGGLVDAVRSNLVSDVPVGCFLSGGIDSSLLVGLAHESLPGLRTFTVGFHERYSDERDYARLIARHFGTLHEESVLEHEGLAQRLWDMQEYYDEPFDPDGPLPAMEVARLARRSDTVVALGGDGADEMFAGYLRYDDFNRPDWVPAGIPAALWRRFARLGGLPLRAAKASDPARYFGYDGCLSDALQRHLFTDGFAGRVPDRATDLINAFFPLDAPAVTAAQYTDMHLYLVDHILCKVDRASMAHGVEARVPYLDPELASIAFRIPLSIQYRNGERKALLKAVAAERLPAAAVTSRKKGFSAPLLAWFEPHLDRWNSELLRDGLLQQLDILRPDWMPRLAGLRERHPLAGARARWLLLAGELWARRWISGAKSNPIPGAAA